MGEQLILNIYLIWAMMKTCTNTYVQKGSMLTEQEVKMQLFHPEALNFEQVNIPLTSRKQWNILCEVVKSCTQLP